MTGLHHRFDEALGRERAHSSENGAASEALADDHRHETVQGRPTTEEPEDRLLGRKKGLRNAHASENRKLHRPWIAIPGLDSLVEGGQEGGHRENLRPAARADSDRSDGPRPSDRFLDGFQAISQIKHIHANGLEIRFQKPESPEARGPKRVTASDEDQSIVRHQSEAWQHMALVEPDRRDQCPDVRGITRGGARFRARER